MPLIPTPTPAVQPTESTLSGGVWVSGAGFNQVSGGPLGHVPYSEVTQWLTIEYTRNPRFTGLDPATSFCDLNVVSGTQARSILSTQLHFNITVHNSKKKIIQDYTLSSSYQPQKFALIANRLGKDGGFYGDVSGPNNQFVFGAQGSLITTQPYVSRQPWIDTATATLPADVEYDMTIAGTNGYLQVSGPGTQETEFGHCDINENFATYIPAHSRLENVGAYPWLNNIGYNDPYPIAGGGYATSAEVAFGNNAAGLQKLIQFIELACVKLGSSIFQQRYALNSPFSSNGLGFIQEDDRVQINPYYTTARHDYT